MICDAHWDFDRGNIINLESIRTQYTRMKHEGQWILNAMWKRKIKWPKSPIQFPSINYLLKIENTVPCALCPVSNVLHYYYYDCNYVWIAERCVCITICYNYYYMKCMYRIRWIHPIHSSISPIWIHFACSIFISCTVSFYSFFSLSLRCFVSHAYMKGA